MKKRRMRERFTEEELNSYTVTQEQRERFGHRLFMHRRSMKMTQDKFANLLGIHRWTLSCWENNRAFPCDQFIILLSKKLGLDVLSWLEPEPPTPPPASMRKVVVKEIIIETVKPKIAELIPGNQKKEKDYEFAS